jgi:hypothetical protein
MKTNNNLPIFGHDNKTNPNNFIHSSPSNRDSIRSRHKNNDHSNLYTNAIRSKKVILTLGDYSKDLHGEAFIQIAGKLVPIGIVNPDFSVMIDGIEYNTNKKTQVFLKRQ